MRTRPPRESSDYFVRQGREPDALAAELSTEGERRRYIATFYTSRFWAHPGGFSQEAVDFMTEPFADGEKLRASFGAYEGSFDEHARAEPAILGENRTHTLILFGPSDHVGPFLVRDAGHFLQWEASEGLNGAIRAFCRDLLGAN